MLAQQAEKQGEEAQKGDQFVDDLRVTGDFQKLPEIGRGGDGGQMALVKFRIELGQAILPAGQPEAAVQGHFPFGHPEKGAVPVKQAVLGLGGQVGDELRHAEVQGKPENGIHKGDDQSGMHKNLLFGAAARQAAAGPERRLPPVSGRGTIGKRGGRSARPVWRFEMERRFT